MIADRPARYNLRLVETEEYTKRHGPQFGHAFAIYGDIDLSNLLLQCVKFRSGEKLSQGDFQSVTDHFDGQQLGVPAFTVPAPLPP